jgi:hypothetical protein
VVFDLAGHPQENPNWADRYVLVKVQAVNESHTSMLGHQNLKLDFVDELRVVAQSWSVDHSA